MATGTDETATCSDLNTPTKGFVMSPNQMPRKASPVRTTKRWDYDSSSESYGVDVDVKVVRSLGKPNRPFAVGVVAAMLNSKVGK